MGEREEKYYTWKKIPGSSQDLNSGPFDFFFFMIILLSPLTCLTSRLYQALGNRLCFINHYDHYKSDFHSNYRAWRFFLSREGGLNLWLLDNYSLHLGVSINISILLHVCYCVNYTCQKLLVGFSRNNTTCFGNLSLKSSPDLHVLYFILCVLLCSALKGWRPTVELMGRYGCFVRWRTWTEWRDQLWQPVYQWVLHIYHMPQHIPGINTEGEGHPGFPNPPPPKIAKHYTNTYKCIVECDILFICVCGLRSHQKQSLEVIKFQNFPGGACP